MCCLQQAVCQALNATCLAEPGVATLLTEGLTDGWPHIRINGILTYDFLYLREFLREFLLWYLILPLLPFYYNVINPSTITSLTLLL